jgi:hypothetical protein
MPGAPAATAVAQAAVRRPGLDLHAGLSRARASSAPVAQPPVQRTAAQPQAASIGLARSTVVSALPAHRPGLDVARALSRSGPAQQHAVVRAAEPAQLTVAPPRTDAPAARFVLQRAAEPAPAAPPSPPTNVVALPTAHEAAPSAEPMTAENGPASAERHRLAEAPDDELEELATRLYDHIRFRLRTEFRIDRERAGLLTDRY